MIFQDEKSKAFTLAEVLITVGIIGVVAGFTIPTLMKKTNDAELKTALKKSYSNLSQAIAQTIAENGNVQYACYAIAGGSYSISECAGFWSNFKAKLRVIKEYSGPVDGANIPDYTGTDLIVAQGGHVNDPSCIGGQIALKNNKNAWILADGSILFSYGGAITNSVFLF